MTPAAVGAGFFLVAVSTGRRPRNQQPVNIVKFRKAYRLIPSEVPVSRNASPAMWGCIKWKTWVLVLSHISPALVVEDDVVLAMQMKDHLTDFGCPETVIATRVEKAFVALNAGIQFAVIDVSIAGEPCNELAKRLVVSGIPFIYFSGYQPGDFPELPAAPWVSKPASEEQLLEAISTALAQPACQVSQL